MRNKNEFLDELEQRGLIFQSTDLDGLNDWLNGGPRTGYLGVDPTADSFHVGHLVPVMIMRWFQKYGHRPVLLVGGATGRIGDPSGRNSDRPMMTNEIVDKNRAGLRKCYGQFLNAEMVDNYDWHKSITHIEFLREYGPAFTIPKMLAMESVKKRLENDMSFLEFNYMPLQAVDFLELFDKYDCRIQLCGADQWGNSVAGASLIRRKRHAEAFVLSCPLITDSQGKKIGKSAGNAVWVDSGKTSPYEYFQYFRNAQDGDVEKFLKIFTEIPLPEIAKIMRGDINEAKRRLAFAATEIAHGSLSAQSAAETAGALFGGGDSANAPVKKMAMPAPVNIVDFLAQADLFSSKSEARRAIEQGGIQLDGIRISDKDFIVRPAESILIQKGKKTFLKIATK